MKSLKTFVNEAVQEWDTFHLAEGRCVLIADGTVDELITVLKAAFPSAIPNAAVESNMRGRGVEWKYYYRDDKDKKKWNASSSNPTGKPAQSVKVFLKNLKERIALTSLTAEEWLKKAEEALKSFVKTKDHASLRLAETYAKKAGNYVVDWDTDDKKYVIRKYSSYGFNRH